LKLRIASLSLLALCLVVLPAAAQTLYSNGPIDGQDTAWTINFGYAVSDAFTLANDSTVNGLSFGAWIFPGDPFVAVEVAITSSEFGGTTYFDQVVNLTQSGCTLNQFGFNVCTASGGFGTNLNLAAGTYWLTLENAEGTDDGLYWDQNSGPSLASESSIGTIPSESFTISGTATGTGTVPEPTAIVLFGSGIVALAGVLRRKLF
jgi:hypothetical protein